MTKKIIFPASQPPIGELEKAVECMDVALYDHLGIQLTRLAHIQVDATDIGSDGLLSFDSSTYRAKTAQLRDQIIEKERMLAPYKSVYHDITDFLHDTKKKQCTLSIPNFYFPNGRTLRKGYTIKITSKKQANALLQEYKGIMETMQDELHEIKSKLDSHLKKSIEHRCANHAETRCNSMDGKFHEDRVLFIPLQEYSMDMQLGHFDSCGSSILSEQGRGFVSYIHTQDPKTLKQLVYSLNGLCGFGIRLRSHFLSKSSLDTFLNIHNGVKESWYDGLIIPPKKQHPILVQYAER
ncbi:MAG: hypothetical protein ACMXYC_03265 [Candidatus Woesearchaeota archaeon]